MTLGGTPEELARQVGERGLCRKLLAERHLNAVERSALPDGRARFSVLVDVVRQALDETGWFPRYVPLAETMGCVDALLESRDGVILLHTSDGGGADGSGMRRYTPFEPKRLSDVRQAVRAYVMLNSDWNAPGRIGGVPIDWDA
jgi:hypothetical protein